MRRATLAKAWPASGCRWMFSWPSKWLIAIPLRMTRSAWAAISVSRSRLDTAPIVKRAARAPNLWKRPSRPASDDFAPSGLPAVRLTCRPTLRLAHSRIPATASSNAAPLAIRLVEVTIPRRWASMMPRLTPRVIPRSSALTTSCFTASGVAPSDRIEPHPHEIAQRADRIADEVDRTGLGKIAELDRNLADVQIEAFGDIEHFDVESKTVQ